MYPENKQSSSNELYCAIVPREEEVDEGEKKGGGIQAANIIFDATYISFLYFKCPIKCTPVSLTKFICFALCSGLVDIVL